ncbi:MAG: AMP-binding protein [Helicobacteraceae bacterium]|jgi:acyl-coenzyme A synthetase/AMP-(fatty) acid ligase|nr:AMP-binding protein [Helicobacteraceae bacterium]
MWSLADFGDRIAAIDERYGAFSYADLHRETLQLALCVNPSRSLAFCLCANEIGSLIGYTAFINNKTVALALNSSLDRGLLQTLIDAYKPAFIWSPSDLIFKDFEKIYESFGYSLLRTPFEPCELFGDLALLLTTSGSTGSPKLVRQSYRNIRANTESIIKYLKMDETHRAITTLPMYYTYGLSIINTHLAVGASIVLTKKTLAQKEFWQAIKENNVTNFGGVPYTYEVLKKLRFFQMRLPSLRYITQAGGKLNVQTCLEFAEGCKKIGVDFIVMYGATEATARMSYVPADRAIKKAGTIGVAIPNGRFEIIGDRGEIINEIGKIGSLIYYGENVTLGYAQNREDLAKKDERNARLETGDLAMIDGEGYYTIVGRKSRFLKLYGNRVNLAEIEALLSKGGFEAACVGEDDCLYIFSTSANHKEAIDFIANITGINRAAFKTIRVIKIPRNETGKILYSELKYV